MEVSNHPQHLSRRPSNSKSIKPPLSASYCPASTNVCPFKQSTETLRELLKPRKATRSVSGFSCTSSQFNHRQRRIYAYPPQCASVCSEYPNPDERFNSSQYQPAPITTQLQDLQLIVKQTLDAPEPSLEILHRELNSLDDIKQAFENEISGIQSTPTHPAVRSPDLKHDNHCGDQLINSNNLSSSIDSVSKKLEKQLGRLRDIKESLDQRATYHAEQKKSKEKQNERLEFLKSQRYAREMQLREMSACYKTRFPSHSFSNNSKNANRVHQTSSSFCNNSFLNVNHDRQNLVKSASSLPNNVPNVSDIADVERVLPFPSVQKPNVLNLSHSKVGNAYDTHLTTEALSNKMCLSTPSSVKHSISNSSISSEINANISELQTLKPSISFSLKNSAENAPYVSKESLAAHAMHGNNIFNDDFRQEKEFRDKSDAAINTNSNVISIVDTHVPCSQLKTNIVEKSDTTSASTDIHSLDSKKIYFKEPCESQYLSTSDHAIQQVGASDQLEGTPELVSRHFEVCATKSKRQPSNKLVSLRQSFWSKSPDEFCLSSQSDEWETFLNNGNTVANAESASHAESIPVRTSEIQTEYAIHFAQPQQCQNSALHPNSTPIELISDSQKNLIDKSQVPEHVHLHETFYNQQSQYNVLLSSEPSIHSTTYGSNTQDTGKKADSPLLIKNNAICRENSSDMIPSQFPSFTNASNDTAFQFNYHPTPLNNINTQNQALTTSESYKPDLQKSCELVESSASLHFSQNQRSVSNLFNDLTIDDSSDFSALIGNSNPL